MLAGFLYALFLEQALMPEDQKVSSTHVMVMIQFNDQLREAKNLDALKEIITARGGDAEAVFGHIPYKETEKAPGGIFALDGEQTVVLSAYGQPVFTIHRIVGGTAELVIFIEKITKIPGVISVHYGHYGTDEVISDYSIMSDKPISKERAVYCTRLFFGSLKAALEEGELYALRQIERGEI